MNQSTISAMLGITLLLSGCAPDQAEFQNSVAKLVKVDMPVNDAVKNLSEAGFSCSDRLINTFPYVCPYHTSSECFHMECTRERINLLISCVERVNFYKTEQGDTIRSIEKPGLTCFGGFG